MEFPSSCRQTIEELVMTSGYTPAALSEAVRRMSALYKESSGRDIRLITKKEEVLAYAVTRMPATFGAVYTALSETLSALSENDRASIHTVLDLGAGTGAASLAAAALSAEFLPNITSITAVEREAEMLALGKQLTAALPFVHWENKDAITALNTYAKEGRTFDLIIASYMTNELSERSRSMILPLLMQTANTCLLLTEPGTKIGAAILRRTRQTLISLGASVCAPCPGSMVCPMTEESGDWCHFTCRVARSKLHKQLKGGDVPYEDEKFSYLGISMKPALPCHARILRHPQKDPGRISLVLCTQNGMEQVSVTKKDKPYFTMARKASCGDGYPPKHIEGKNI
ncbi:MAG: methyltransferase domain-containing protein [Clostridia bacterium]|nr:methyltransferase domain-containing protein [Clostridia bacterium]